MEPQLILVVMPLYNARPYVRAAIESILAQTYSNFRLLVINDGSTDGSEQEATVYQGPKVLLWSQENQGPGVAMNRALQYAHEMKINFIARVDSDDISTPDRLEKQITLMQKNPNSAACSANCFYINPDSEKIIGTSTISTSNRLIHWEITHGLRGLIQSVCLFRTNALYKIHGYRSQFKLAEEVDVLLRLAESYELCNCKEFLAKIRINPKSLSLSNVHENILYQFYALDCAKKRSLYRLEHDFNTFLQTMPLEIKYRVWREEYLLRLWRSYILGANLPSILLASLLDPRRVLVRLLRKVDECKHG